MKNLYLKFVLMFLVMVGSCQISLAQVDLPFIDSFDYTADATNGLETQSSAVWIRTGSTNPILVTAGSLAYTGIATSGNRITLSGQTDHYHRIFKKGAPTAYTKHYASFILKVTQLPDASAPATGDYFIALGNSGGATSNFALVYLRKSVTTGKFNIGILKRGSAVNITGDIAWLATDLDINTTYNLVFGAAQNATNNTDDVVKLWLNPSDYVNEPTPSISSSTGADLNNYNNIVWTILENTGLNTGLQLDIDELHVSTVWSGFTTLPVTFDKFIADAQANRTKLSWNTFSEQNNNHFQVERSSDGTNFAFLKQVTGNGTTNTASAYTIYDNNPFNGINYYRLIQVDNDGKRTELAIKSVSFNMDDAVSVSVYPNPIGSEINLLLKNYTGSFKAVLSSLDGRVVHQQTIEAVNGQSVYLIPLISKPIAGTYILQVIGDGGLVKSVKVIVP